MKGFIFEEAKALASFASSKITAGLASECALLLGELTGQRVSIDQARDWLDCAVARRGITLMVLQAKSRSLVGISHASLLDTFVPKISINDVIIQRDFRQIGIGTAMMKELMRRATSQWPSARWIEFTSLPGYKARRFCEGLGFVERDANVYVQSAHERRAPV